MMHLTGEQIEILKMMVKFPDDPDNPIQASAEALQQLAAKGLIEPTQIANGRTAYRLTTHGRAEANAQ